MDPNANLKEMLEIAQTLLDAEEEVGSEAARLAELVLALNEWIGKGGFLPARWKQK